MRINKSQMKFRVQNYTEYIYIYIYIYMYIYIYIYIYLQAVVSETTCLDTCTQCVPILSCILLLTLLHVAEINEKMLDCAHYAYIKQTLILANKFGKWEREQSSIFILYV